ncbi:hypothetical protein Sjap_020107 [Stephania japonica]|uniref:Uncharacterized protein n=1 Tax=Stephania japonica TaxID=461633 RepID=A0AAP0HVB9_9MAGN
MMSSMKIVWLVLMALLYLTNAQSFAPSPAPGAGPMSDGTTIDQGVACTLLLVALALTYILH